VAPELVFQLSEFCQTVLGVDSMSVGDVLTQIRADNVIKCSWVAAAAVMVYDYGLTIQHEHFMWQRRWSLGKCLYLFTRYLGLVTVILDISVMFTAGHTEKFCKATFWWELFSSASAIISAQVVLLFRVYAVYERDNKLLGALAITMAIGTLASSVVLSLYRPVLSETPLGLTGCSVRATPRKFFLGGLPSLIIETILCLLMILKAIQHHRYRSSSPLMSKMLRDSVVYFVSIIVTLAIVCASCIIAGGQWSPIGVVWESTVACTMACRLLVNIIEHRQDTHSLDWSEIRHASQSRNESPVFRRL